MCFCLCNLAIAIDTLSDIKYDRRIDVEMNDCGSQFFLMCESQVGNAGQTRRLRRAYCRLHLWYRVEYLENETIPDIGMQQVFKSMLAIRSSSKK